VCSHVGRSSMYDTRQLGLPSRDGQRIGLVRRTGVNITAAIFRNSNCDFSAADHPIPIYSVFGSRTGFSRSADRIALIPVAPNSIGMRVKPCARSNYIGDNLKYFLLFDAFIHSLLVLFSECCCRHLTSA